ncbi:MAG: IPT/TIG domain-containing protein, partial [Candidatus Solibacter sp.]
MVLAEFSGAGLTVDKSALAAPNNAATCPSAGPLSVTTTGSTLLIGALVENVTNGTTSFSSGTLVQGQGSQKGAFQLVYQLAPVAGTYTQQFAFSPGYNAGNQSCALVALRANSAAPPAPGPVITSITPGSGTPGSTVTIAGTNFGASQGMGMVQFGSITAVPTSWSSTIIVVPVPTGASTGNIVVTVGGVASNGNSFTVIQPPTMLHSVRCSKAANCAATWPVTAGNLLTVMFADGVGQGGNISDSQLNAYNTLKSIGHYASGLTLLGTVLKSSGALNVTSSGVHGQIVLVEFSGVGLTVDASTQAAPDNSANCPSGAPLSVTTTGSDLLISAMVGNVTNGSTSFSSGTLVEGVGSQVGAFQFVYQLAPAAGTHTQRFTFAPGYNSGNQSCALVALRALA